MNKHLHEVMDENSILEFEKSKFSESYTGPGIRRILSTSSINLGSQCHLAGNAHYDVDNHNVSCNAPLPCGRYSPMSMQLLLIVIFSIWEVRIFITGRGIIMLNIPC